MRILMKYNYRYVNTKIAPISMNKGGFCFSMIALNSQHESYCSDEIRLRAK